MSALDELMEKSLLKCTRLESAIIDAWAFGSVKTAEAAAEELAALRRVAEAAREFLDDETFLRPYTTTQEDALKSAFAEYDKCRAA